jgi:hypothetical protein
LCTYIKYSTTIDLLLFLFNIKDNSKVDCRYSLIINKESNSNNNSKLDNKTLSNSLSNNKTFSNLRPLNLNLLTLNTSYFPKSKFIKGLHYYNIKTQMLALTKKRDNIKILLIT